MPVDPKWAKRKNYALANRMYADPATRCTAASRTWEGERCSRKVAEGSTVCIYHGAGNAVSKNAARERIQRTDLTIRAGYHLVGMGADPNVARQNPMQGLLDEVHQSALTVAYLRLRVSRFRSLTEETPTGPKPRVVYRMYCEERDRHAKFCKMAIDAGLAERTVKVAERQVTALLEVVVATFSHPDLALTDQQINTARKFIANGLRTITMAAA